MYNYLRLVYLCRFFLLSGAGSSSIILSSCRRTTITSHSELCAFLFSIKPLIAPATYASREPSPATTSPWQYTRAAGFSSFSPCSLTPSRSCCSFVYTLIVYDPTTFSPAGFSTELLYVHSGPITASTPMHEMRQRAENNFIEKYGRYTKSKAVPSFELFLW